MLGEWYNGPGPGVSVHASALAFGPDGSLYYSVNESSVSGVRRIDPTGVYSTVVGYASGPSNGPPSGYAGDGALATDPSVRLSATGGGIRVASDGTLYIADTGNHRVRRVDPRGVISTIAGNGAACGQPYADGTPAASAALQPNDVAVMQDGTPLIADGCSCRVVAINPNGTLRTVVGDPTVNQGSPAYGNSNCTTQTTVLQNNIPSLGGGHMFLSGDPARIDVGPDGTIYMLAPATYGVRTAGPDGVFRILVNVLNVAGAPGDNGPPEVASLGTQASGISLSPNGAVYITELFNSLNVRRLAPSMPGYPADPTQTQAIPSEDGSEIYIFNSLGRHLDTYETVTGTDIAHFQYGDPTGTLLTGIQNAYGEWTTIQRDSSGNPQSITSPFGQVTSLTLDGNGYLATVSQSNGTENETVALNHSSAGLLQTLTDPNAQDTQSQGSHTHSFQYSTEGYLTSDADPIGATQTLTRTSAPATTPASDPPSWTVTYASAQGHVTQYAMSGTEDTSLTTTVTSPSGATSQSVRGQTATSSTSLGGGLTVTNSLAGDPRFGMGSPYASSTSVQISGVGTSTVYRNRTAIAANETADAGAAAGIAQLAQQTDQVSIGDLNFGVANTFTSTYQWANPNPGGTLTTTSPLGRVTTSNLDGHGRVTQWQVQPRTGETQLATVNIAYDSDANEGRVLNITAGIPGSTTVPSRTTAFGYYATDTGFVQSVTDPAGAQATFVRDGIGRVLNQTLNSDPTTQIGFNYDLNGNLTALTPPGRSSHGLSYFPTNLLNVYLPPASSADAGASTTNTSYTYNGDTAETMEARPDGTTSVAYDYYGRLATISGTSTDPLVGGTPHTISYTYDSFDRVSTIVSDSGTAGSTLSYTYAGPLLQSVTWSGAVAGSVSRTYDPAHAMRPLSLTLAGASGSQVVNYGYNNDYLLTSAGPAAGGMSYPREVSTGLPLAGPTTTLGSLSESYGASGSPGFNAFGELLAFSCSCPSCGANSGTGYAVQYGRDSAGRIKQKTETVTGGASPGTTTTTYTYDANERLWTATTGTTTTTWVYDSNGNRTTRNGVVVATFDPQDRLLTYVSPINGASTYTYTNNGDLQTRSSPVTGQFTYTYDLFGRLIGVNAAGVQVTYVNDGVGRRVGRYVGAIGQQFLYDGDKVVAELDANGNLVSVFVYGLKPNVPDYMIRIGSNPGTYRILSDSLGSVRMVVNASTGAIAQQISYDEWGNVTSVPIDIANPTYYTWVGFQPFGYAGGLFDRATGLVHFGARDYDPDTGRWTRKDPIGFDGRDTNLYRYVDDDPINNVDTSGHGITANQSWAEAQIAIAEAGGDAFTTVVSGAVALGVLAHAVATPAISCPLPTQPYVVPALPVVWSIKKAPPRPPLSNRPYPKGDGTTAPEPDWEWKGPDAPGGNQGGWVSPDGSESLHPDLDHPPPVGPHWDWTGPGGQWRIFPDGRIVPKKENESNLDSGRQSCARVHPFPARVEPSFGQRRALCGGPRRWCHGCARPGAALARSLRVSSCGVRSQCVAGQLGRGRRPRRVGPVNR